MSTGSFRSTQSAYVLTDFKIKALNEQRHFIPRNMLRIIVKKIKKDLIKKFNGLLEGLIPCLELKVFVFWFCFLIKNIFQEVQLVFQRLSSTQIVLEGFGGRAKMPVLLTRTPTVAAWTVVGNKNAH